MLRRTNPLTSFTLWILAAALIFVAAQLFEPTGVPLRLMHVAQYNGYIPYMLLLALIVDCLAGPIPLVAIVLPVAACAVFGYWYKQQYELDRALFPPIIAELEKANASVVPHHFDPATETLALSGPILLLRYDIPAVYRPDENIKETIKPLKDCQPPAKAPPRDVRLIDFSAGGRRYCVHQEPGTPPGSVLKTVPAGVYKPVPVGRHWMSRSTTNLTKDGQAIAEYTSSTVEALPPIPWITSECGLDDASIWTCVAKWSVTPVYLDTLTGRRPSPNTLVAEMLLDLPPRDPSEIAALTAP